MLQIRENHKGKRYFHVDLHGLKLASGGLAHRLPQPDLFKELQALGVDVEGSGAARSNSLFLPIFDASFLPWHLTHKNSLAIPLGLIREREPRLSHIEQR